MNSIERINLAEFCIDKASELGDPEWLLGSIAHSLVSIATSLEGLFIEMEGVVNELSVSMGAIEKAIDNVAYMIDVNG